MHADSDVALAYRQDSYRKSALAQAYRTGEPVVIVWHPEHLPRKSGAEKVEHPLPYWIALSSASDAEKATGEIVHPPDLVAAAASARYAGAGSAAIVRQAAILAQIRAERERQNSLWGGAEHDDQHQLSDWLVILVRHCGLAAWDGSPDDACHKTEATGKYDPIRYRKELVRVAAVAVAALEAFDRKLARLTQAEGEDGS